MSTPRVVIVGVGFAGLNAAKALRKAPVRLTIIDRRNFHLFQPLLYQVATAALNPSDIAYPIRSIFRRQRNVESVLLAEVVNVDLAASEITLDDGQAILYDYLVVATGATHSYFGHDEWSEVAPGLKTIEDALVIRSRILRAFEEAERNPDQADRWLSFVVVGAGPTGVELAGALIEIAVHAVGDEFDAVDPRNARVVLVEGTDRVLPPYPQGLSASARYASAIRQYRFCIDRVPNRRQKDFDGKRGRNEQPRCLQITPAPKRTPAPDARTSRTARTSSQRRILS